MSTKFSRKSIGTNVKKPKIKVTHKSDRASSNDLAAFHKLISNLTKDKACQRFYELLISIVTAVAKFHRENGLLMYPYQSGWFQTAQLDDFKIVISDSAITTEVIIDDRLCESIGELELWVLHPKFATSDDTRALGFLFNDLVSSETFCSRFKLSDDCRQGIKDLSIRMMHHDDLDNVSNQLTLQNVIKRLHAQHVLCNETQRQKLITQLQKTIGAKNDPAPETILGILNRKLNDAKYIKSQTCTSKSIQADHEHMSEEYTALKQVKTAYENLAVRISTLSQSSDGIYCHIKDCIDIYKKALANTALGKCSGLFTRISHAIKWLWASCRHMIDTNYHVPVFDNAKDTVKRASNQFTLLKSNRRNSIGNLAALSYPTLQYFS